MYVVAVFFVVVADVLVVVSGVDCTAIGQSSYLI